MNHTIDDNRFVLIEKYKQRLIEGTNISDRQEEMAVLDSILFRFWQMGWLDKLEEESKWIPCSERLPKTNDPVNVTWVNRNPEVYYMDIKDKPFTATAHYHKGHWYWYSSVTQDYLDEYGEFTPDLVDKDVEIIAWMPLPKEYRGE